MGKVKDIELDVYTYKHIKNHYDLIDDYEPVPIVNDLDSFNREVRFFFDYFETFRYNPKEMLKRTDDMNGIIVFSQT